jgi:hypothetical protein
VTAADEEIAEQQADTTRLLATYLHAPVVEDCYLLGVLPAPQRGAAIRLVVGARTAGQDQPPIAYEFPLRTHGALLTAPDTLGMLRTVLTGAHIYSSNHVTSVMGMTLIQIPPGSVSPTPPTAQDGAEKIMRALLYPPSEDTDTGPRSRMRGFLSRDHNRLRLYFDTLDHPGVIAADVRPTRPLTALIAAIPSLVREEERFQTDPNDPHCDHLVDLTAW